MLDGNTAARLSYEGIPVAFPRDDRTVVLRVGEREVLVRVPPLSQTLELWRMVGEARGSGEDASRAFLQVTQLVPAVLVVGNVSLSDEECFQLLVSLTDHASWAPDDSGETTYVPAPTHDRAMHWFGLAGRAENGAPGAFESLLRELAADLRLGAECITPLEVRRLLNHVLWPPQLQLEEKPDESNGDGDGKHTESGLDVLTAEFYAEYGSPAPDLPHPMWIGMVLRLERFAARRELTGQRATYFAIRGALGGEGADVYNMRLDELHSRAFPSAPAAEWDGPEMAIVQEDGHGE